MKRFFVILLILLFFLSSCGNEKFDILEYQSYPMTVTGTLKQGDFSCAVTVNIKEKGVADITIESPETLTGYSFTVDNGTVWVYYDNMEIELHTASKDIPFLWVSDMLSVNEEDYTYSHSEGEDRLDFFVNDISKTVVYTRGDKTAPYRIEYSKENDTLIFDIDTLIVQ